MPDEAAPLRAGPAVLADVPVDEPDQLGLAPGQAAVGARRVGLQRVARQAEQVLERVREDLAVDLVADDQGVAGPEPTTRVQRPTSAPTSWANQTFHRSQLERRSLVRSSTTRSHSS